MSDSVSIEVPGRDVAGLRAANPGPFSLSGTNTWIVGRDPAWLIDPGPAIEAHLAAIDAELARRGGVGGVLLTHDHSDHSASLPAIRERHPGVPVAAARGEVERRIAHGDTVGPLEVFATPGHAEDHLAFLGAGGVLFSGDAVLGEGSVFVAPAPRALARYLDALERLRQLALELICPGHGPLVPDARAKLTGYIEHRRARESALIAALADGLRSPDELLDRVWADAPLALRLAAGVTLAAHLDKLAEEGRLPPGVERPDTSWLTAPGGDRVG